jgi:hypothetical protein
MPRIQQISSCRYVLGTWAVLTRCRTDPQIQVLLNLMQTKRIKDLARQFKKESGKIRNTAATRTIEWARFWRERRSVSNSSIQREKILTNWCWSQASPRDTDFALLGRLSGLDVTISSLSIWVLPSSTVCGTSCSQCNDVLGCSAFPGR